MDRVVLSKSGSSRPEGHAASLASVISRDGVPIPTSTLLVRLTPLPEVVPLVPAAEALAASVHDHPACAAGAMVAWIGEVTSDAGQALAAATMCTDGDTTVVGAWHVTVDDPDGWLASRLLRGIADAGAARGAWRVRLPADPALEAAATGLGWRSDDGCWTIEA